MILVLRLDFRIFGILQFCYVLCCLLFGQMFPRVCGVRIGRYFEVWFSSALTGWLVGTLCEVVFRG